MSQLGHFRKSIRPKLTSALPLKADIRRPDWYVCFVPSADIPHAGKAAALCN
jgi:hypothetical protein